VAVRGDQLLLNGQPIRLTGFGKHEDFPDSIELRGNALSPSRFY
jgi:beta-galactosidase/beta-glucuronidase